MDKLKYIRTEYDIVIFSSTISHDTFKSLKPKSAGFCSVNGDKRTVSCYGESWSLGIQSNPKEDSELATRQVFGLEAMLNMEKKES